MQIFIILIVVLGSICRNNAILPPCAVLQSSQLHLYQQANFPEKIQKSLQINLNRFVKGGKELFTSFMGIQALKKKRKRDGLQSLTYDEYKMLQTHDDDLSKVFRMAITIPISPELFLYSYVIIPLISFTTNYTPWIFKTFPSTFEYPEEIKQRKDIIEKRRYQGLTNMLQWYKSHSMEQVLHESKDPYLKQQEVIEKVLESKSISYSLELLAQWYITTTTSNNKKRNEKAFIEVTHKSAQLKNIPWPIVKDCVKAIGSDGLPNIWFIRRFNLNEIQSYLKRLRESDGYLFTKGGKSYISSLSSKNLEELCNERFISTKRDVSQLRKSLEQWLDHMNSNSLTTLPMSITSSFPMNNKYVDQPKVTVNEQNKRFVLLALQVYNDIKTSEYSSSYRKLFN